MKFPCSKFEGNQNFKFYFAACFEFDKLNEFWTGGLKKMQKGMIQNELISSFINWSVYQPKSSVSCFNKLNCVITISLQQ